MTYRNKQFDCPGCKEPLRAVNFARCVKCQGNWVSKNLLLEKLRDIRGQHELDLKLVLERFDSSSSSRNCPSCRCLLEELTLGTVVIDHCSECHGIWFDHNELQNVLVASRNGEGVNLKKVPHQPINDIRRHDLQGSYDDTDYENMSLLMLALEFIFSD